MSLEISPQSSIVNINPPKVSEKKVSWGTNLLLGTCGVPFGMLACQLTGQGIYQPRRTGKRSFSQRIKDFIDDSAASTKRSVSRCWKGSKLDKMVNKMSNKTIFAVSYAITALLITGALSLNQYISNKKKNNN